MMRIEMIWLALGASDLRGGIDILLAQVLRGFAGGAQPHTPTCSPTDAQIGSRCWSTTGSECGCAREACKPVASRGRAGAFELTREQFDWLVAGLPWQRLSAPQPQRITVN